MELAQFVPQFDVSRLKGATIIIPAVSLGNVPQLAADLLLHTHSFHRVGSLNDDYLYPFASPIDTLPDTPEPAGISTALEIYHSDDLGFTLLQQRSPIIPTFTKKFAQEIIVPFVAKYEFTGVIVLDSGDAGLLEAAGAGSIETYTNEDLLSKSIESLSISEKVHALQTNYDYTKFVKHVLEKLDSSLKTTVFVIFVYEGENFHEATLLANKVRAHLEIDPAPWNQPASWLGVYGNKPIPSAMEDGIYG